MSRSFRQLLALRFALITTAGMGLCVLVTFLVVRHVLDAELNASVMNVASIQAAAVTDAKGGEMHFHEWELSPDEVEVVRDLVRYAQIWDAQGRSLLRSRYMVRDLPLEPGALQAAAGGELVWREAEYQDYRIRSVYYPLERMGPLHRGHVLQVAAPLEPRDAMLQRVALLGLLLLGGTAAASLLGGRWLATRSLRPVTDIINEAQGVDPASGTARISAYADTVEYQRLVRVLNGMLGRIQESLEAQRRFTADASHELRSPLTAMRGELELALRKPRAPEEYRSALESAHEEVLRMSHIVEGLLTLARADAGAMEFRRSPRDLEVVAREVVGRLASDGERAGVTLEVVAPHRVVGAVDGELLRQALGNLLANAVEALRDSGGGSVRVTVEGGAEGEAILTVEDTGPGLPPGSETAAFQRFWRGDPSRTHGEGGVGIGLGLAIVHAIATAHGGRVEADGSPDLGGARFRMWIRIG